ncbi:MAG: hypothetical protein AAGB93_22230 [Planctomycetota bacterium]
MTSVLALLVSIVLSLVLSIPLGSWMGRQMEADGGSGDGAFLAFLLLVVPLWAVTAPLLRRLTGRPPRAWER